jgi:hypothetical protein
VTRGEIVENPNAITDSTADQFNRACDVCFRRSVQARKVTDGRTISYQNYRRGTDQPALAETIVTVLFIARKQARDAGECDQSEQRQDPRSGEDRVLKRLLCDPLAQQEAKGAFSAQELRLKSIASPPKG